MSPGGPVEMQEAVALCAKGAAGAAIDYGDGGTVIMVCAVRPRLPTRITSAIVTITMNSILKKSKHANSLTLFLS